KFLKLHPEVYDKLILGSGSGHKLSFPGISGIQELGILQSVNKKKERLFKIPTVNTCSYIGVENSGKIKEGYEANLILYSENPTNKYSHLYKIEKVYYQGDLVDPYKGMK
ncbi:MAG: hypothetical protein KDK36_08280, partial [Leptospiraceae bacterium]|nr:hypothetical protein [Leptospiraceae bacterium]